LSPIRIIVRMPEPDYFLRYRIIGDIRGILRREIPRIRIRGPPLQRGVVLKWVYSPSRRNTFVGGTCVKYTNKYTNILNILKHLSALSTLKVYECPSRRGHISVTPTALQTTAALVQLCMTCESSEHRTNVGGRRLDCVK